MRDASVFASKWRRRDACDTPCNRARFGDRPLRTLRRALRGLRRALKGSRRDSRALRRALRGSARPLRGLRSGLQGSAGALRGLRRAVRRSCRALRRLRRGLKGSRRTLKGLRRAPTLVGRRDPQIASAGIASHVFPSRTRPFSFFDRWMPSAPNAPHCLKKNRTFCASHWRWMLRTHSGRIGLAP